MWLRILEKTPEFLNLPEKERRKAAYYAQEKALLHWQVLVSILFLMFAVVAISMLDMYLLISDANGTGGAMCGFLVGGAVLQRAFLRFGLPYYQEALKDRRFQE